MNTLIKVKAGGFFTQVGTERRVREDTTYAKGRIVANGIQTDGNLRDQV